MKNRRGEDSSPRYVLSSLLGGRIVTFLLFSHKTAKSVKNRDVANLIKLLKVLKPGCYFLLFLLKCGFSTAGDAGCCRTVKSVKTSQKLLKV